MIDSLILGFMDSDPLTLLALSLFAGAVVVGIVRLIVAVLRSVAKA